MASHQVVTFGSHRHCNSEDIMFLVCHMVVQDHVIKELYDFMGRSHRSILPSLVAIGTVVVEI